MEREVECTGSYTPSFSFLVFGREIDSLTESLPCQKSIQRLQRLWNSKI